MDQQPQLSGRMPRTGQASEKSLSSSHSNIGGTRTNRSRKANPKSQGSKFREGTAAADAEYLKHGPSSANNQKDQRSLRGASEHSSKRPAASTMNDQGKALQQDEERKTGTVSSKSNTAAGLNGKKSESSKGATTAGVSKKKKQKVADKESSQQAKSNKASKKVNLMQLNNSNPVSEVSGPRKDERPIKTTSSASARRGNKQQTGSSNAGSSAPKKDKMKLTGVISEASQNMTTDNLMKSTFKSNDAPQTISNWNQSQSQNNEQTNMMGNTQGSLESARNETQQQIEAARDPNQDSTQTAVNLPASPASKAPHLRITVPPSQLEIQENSIEEIDEDCPSPVSAGPILQKSNNKQQEGITFGIRLQKLEESSNLNVVGQLSRDKPQDIQASATQNNSFLESPSSIKHNMIEQSNEKGDPKIGPDGKPIRPELTEPLPILPKIHSVFQMPVKCPIENIRFVNLKRFQQYQKQKAEMMSAGFDLVGQRRKMIQLKTEDKIKKGGGIENQEQLAKMDDTTHFIKSLVYARDPKIIDQEKQHVHQRDAFSHLNNLDVKVLISKSQMLGDESKAFNMSPRSIQRRMPREQQQKQFLDSQVYKLKDAEDKTLLFESRFESGNLYLAQKVSDQEYNLLMSNDINTQGHTQWFFFQVKNTRAGHKVRFNILNYSKPDSLFNYGMKVSVYSDKKSELENLGWHKDCEDIRYFQNGIKKDVTYYSKSYYTATFTYTFKHSDDLVYFAYSTPYTYSDLRNDLAAIETDQQRSRLVKKKTLCRTLSGEPCEVLTITSADNLENFSQRKGVVITARVHPGETVGSWMMRGVLTFLTDPDNYEAKLLRESFVFKVIPMLNPDGVINGNYRCSLAGCDLNRRWKVPNKTLHPTIYHTKRLVKQIHQERGLVLYCDLHGHSRKQNVFMYGCNNKSNPGECRIFPYILDQMNNFFCYEYSRFGVQKSKESTARVALFKELKTVPNIYTMESSFAGCDMGPSAGKHLTTGMLETLGHDVCRAVLIYSNLYVPPELRDKPFFKNIMLAQQAQKKTTASSLNKKEFKEPVFNIKDAINGLINTDTALCQNGGGGDGESSSGSDSAPSEDNMQAEELIKQLPVADKTLKLQIKKNQEKKKQEEQTNAQSTVKLRRQSSGHNLKRNEHPKRQQSPLKRPIIQEKKEEPKPEEPKKKKVEMKDACTQTERSDYSVIKEKQRLKALKLKEQQAALQAAQQKGGTGLIAGDRKLINDLQRGPGELGKLAPSAVAMENAQRLQQIVNINDSKSRTNPSKLPLTQTYTNNQLQALSGQVSANYSVTGHTSKTEKNSRNGASTIVESHGPVGSQKIMIPDNKKYNFMGVSSIKQGQQVPNGYKQSPNFDYEYGAMARSPHGTSSPTKQGGMPSHQTMNQGLSAASKQVYHTTRAQQDLLQESSASRAKNAADHPSMNYSSKNDSRKSDNRNGANSNKTEFPAMTTTLSHKTNNSANEKKAIMGNAIQQPNQAMNHGLKQQIVSNRIGQGTMQPQSYSMSKRSHNFETDIGGTQQFNSNGQVFNPIIDGKAQFVLPQTKQLPQKEFVMMEVGAKGSNRKVTRNGKHQNNQSQLTNAQSATQAYHTGQPSASHGQQISRFNSQKNRQSGNNSTEQTLIRNNSTVANASGKYNAPLGASPMVQKGSHLPHKNAADAFSTQLQEMPLSQTMVTRNSITNAASHQPPSVDLTSGTMQLRGSMQAVVENQSPANRKPAQVWKPGAENTPSHQYRPMGGHGLAHSHLDHADNCTNKLPELNLRQQQKTTRGVSGSHNPQAGVINGLNIVLKSGQGSLQTPSQKKQNFQKAKFQNQLATQPQMISTSLVSGVVAQSQQQQQWTGSAMAGGASVNGSQLKGPADFSNNTSAATHKRTKAHGSMQNMAMQMNNNFAKTGSRTPSSNQLHRDGKHGNEILATTTNPRAKPQNSPFAAMNIGAASLQEGLNTDDMQSPTVIRKGPKNNNGSVVPRLRNQSEIAETRNKKVNYETHDNRGGGSNKNVVKQGNTGGVSVSSVLTPQVNYNKRSMIQNNNSQAKVVGKRYSGH